MMDITIVKSMLNDRPRYRVAEFDVKSDADLANLPADMRVTRSFKNASAVVVAIAIKNGGSANIKVYETKTVLADPVHPEKDEKDEDGEITKEPESLEVVEPVPEPTSVDPDVDIPEPGSEK